jgi:hypothetical protein
LGRRLISPATSVVRALLCLALAGCSAKEETVIPPQPQAPQIVAQPSIVVFGLSAMFTGTININGIDTECYFEYGPTASYGRKLPSKFIQAKLNNIVISDTVQNLGVDSTYHCRLVAMNPAGKTESDGKEFTTASGPPILVSETSVSISGTSAILTATVNANCRPTDYHFEYGQTTAYGVQTATKAIEVGGANIAVCDTITGLACDTTYHCRLVAENSAGRTESTDKAFSLAEFVYPLTVGTQWKYSYEEWCLYGYHVIPGYIGSHIRGTQMWTVVGTGSADSVYIQVSRIDSIERYDQSDSVMTSVTSFTVSISQSNYRVRWFELILAPFADREYRDNYFRSVTTVPRYVESGTTTLSIGDDQGMSSAHQARYVDGKGLVSYRHILGGHSSVNETLTLDSVFVAP